MESEVLAQDIKNVLNSGMDVVDGPFYSVSHKKLGEMSLHEGNYLEAVYHFTEAHGIGLRQTEVLSRVRGNPSHDVENDHLSLASSYSKDGVDGMLRRLREMPSEWTLVQITRRINSSEILPFRKSNESPKLKEFFLSRLPCGPQLMEKNIPVVMRRTWPDDVQYDLIEAFLKLAEKLGIKKGSASLIKKSRKEAEQDLERYLRDVGPLCFREWCCLLLGKLYNPQLEKEVRDLVDNRLEGTEAGLREKYLCYLLAEGSCHLSNADLEIALYQVFETNENLAVRVLETLVRIKEDYGSRLHIAKRHPVILILDDHLDVICWESLPFLKRHPICRLYSLHVAHFLYLEHKEHIKDGLREIDGNEEGFYILNPEGNLPETEDKLLKFFQKRFPNWSSLVGRKPSEEEILKALTEPNAYMYCGHGSGAQFIRSERIQDVRVQPVQLLYGCSSVALRDLGGFTEMHGEVMAYTLAKSCCILGMLWPVTNTDTNKMTMVLANLCFPGTPVDIQTFEPQDNGAVRKEPELLRALREARDCVSSLFNGAALIARGLPIRLVDKTKGQSKSTNSSSTESS